MLGSLLTSIVRSALYSAHINFGRIRRCCFDCTSGIIGTVELRDMAMSGVELIIFGAGPAVGMVISFVAWLYEGYYNVSSDSQYNHDWI